MQTTAVQLQSRLSADGVGAPPLLAAMPRSESTYRAVWKGLHWILFGNVTYAVSQYGMLVALAHVSTPRQVGQYALALAIAGPAMFFCNMQLRAILASDAGRTYQFSEFWRLRILTVPLAWAIVAAIAVFGRYGLETSLVIFAVGGAKSLETMADLCYGANQRNNRLDLVGKSLTIKGPLSLALLGAITWATQSIAIGMAGVGTAWLLLLLLYDLPNVRRSESVHAARSRGCQPWQWKRQWRLLAVGLPLAVSITLLSLTVALPNILVERYLGEHDVGIYAALASLAWAGMPLINALGQTAMPKFGELYVIGEYHRLRTAVIFFAALAGALGLASMTVIWICGERVVALCYGPQYGGHVGVLMWLMLAATLLFAARFVADALTAMRRIRIQLLTQAATVLLVFAGSIVVLPESGLAGVAKVLTAAVALRGLILTAGFLSETSTMRPCGKLSCG